MFDRKAQWIWDASDRKTYHHYLQARETFTVPQAQLANPITLQITACSYYMVTLNGKVIGHGPAKSAHGKRSVDTYDLRPFAQRGENELIITALTVGAGTMTAAYEDAGLIFQINVGKRIIVSDSKTQVRPDPTRKRPTSRRWIMPCVEDVDAAGLAKRSGWKNATVIDASAIQLYERRVPLPSREVLPVKRVVSCDAVKLPNVNVTFIVKPYLVDEKQRYRCNTYHTHAYLISEIHSPIDQTFELAPALGNFAWWINGKHMVDSNGWNTSAYGDKPIVVKLSKGKNLLVGISRHSHHEDACICGHADRPLTFKNPYGKGMFALILDEPDAKSITGKKQLTTEWAAMPGMIKGVKPAHGFTDGAIQPFAEGARVIKPLDADVNTATLDTLTLPAAKNGTASRTIVDLGVLHNGYLCFDSEAHDDGRLIFSMFEAIREDPQVMIHWPGINNALRYRVAKGRQSFESFFAYGVRYIAIHHTGSKPVTLKNLRVLTANCNMVAKGSLQTDNPIINAIYKQGVQSQLSGMDDSYTDCPTFEQVNWNYDNRTTALANYVTFSSDAITQNSIRLFSEDPHFQGMVRSQYPSDWENFIPLWSFHWIMWVRDYWWHSGDAAFAKQMMPCITRGLEHALSLRDERGLLSMPGVWHFVDWAQGRDDDHAVNAAEQGGLLGALEAAIQLGQVLGKTFGKQASQWQKQYDQLKASINEHLWCNERQAYADSLHADGSPSPVSSMVTNALLCLHGVADEKRSRMLAQRMTKGPEGGLLDYGSPLGVFYMLELYDQLEMIEPLFAIIAEHWGEMTLQGDTCGWEHFKKGRPANAYWPTRSRCHPCSAVALKYIIRWVLGVRQTAPGWKQFTVKPVDTGLPIHRVWGSVPSPEGLIRVSWGQNGDKIKQMNVISPKI
ncbi:MAG: alpha-L-rhamnosidase [Phycisphaeraceae bacterium]|nr:alpha-L-rhamnosidase [Phycisphaeraceae bacterium]